eukprot:jgi/Picsp_1/2460/NSC_05921-R1_tor signaling pathway regulator
MSNLVFPSAGFESGDSLSCMLQKVEDIFFYGVLNGSEVGCSQVSGLGRRNEGRKRGVLQKVLEEVHAHVLRAGMFSTNETKDDLTALSMRCLLVPYYRAEVLLEQGQPGEEESMALLQNSDVVAEEFSKSRLQAIESSLRLFTEYLERCMLYGVLEPLVQRQAMYQLEGVAGDDRRAVSGRSDAATAREMKIEAFRAEKAIKSGLERLRGRYRAQLGDEEVDDDVVRSWVLLAINHSAIKSANAISGLRKERELLNLMVEMSDAEKKEARDQASEAAEVMSAAMRDAAQGMALGSKRESMRRDVFKPSHTMATISVEKQGEIEFREMQERMAREASNSKGNNAIIQTYDDDVEVLKQRAWDDFKDDNPRGWGNSRLRPTG